MGPRPQSDQSVPARLGRAADLLARYRFQLWRYGDSIGLEGLLAAADVLEAPEYWGWAYGALKAWGGRPAPTFVEMDNTAPGHALCLCFERCGDDALMEAAVELAAFLCQRQSLEGVFVSWAQTPLRPRPAVNA